MKVTCSKCGTEYNFDDAKVTDEGVKVKCTRCENVFKVRKKSFVLTEPIQGAADPITTPTPAAPAGEQEPSQPSVSFSPGSKRKWTIRKPAGDQLEFDEMTTLQRWIVERKIAADDEISHNGVKWKRLGSIAELEPFFKAAEGSQPSVSVPATPARRSKESPAGVLLGLVAIAGLLVAWAHFTDAGQEYTRPARVWLADTTGVKIGREYYPAPSPTPEGLVITDPTSTAVITPSTPVSTPTAVAQVSPTPVAPASPTPTKVVSGGRQDVDTLLQKGYEAYSRGRYREAITKYQAAINAGPDNSEAYALLGLAYLDAGNDDLAESSLEASIRLNPRFADAHRYLGLLYSKRNDKARAIQAFNMYLDLRPNGPTSDDVRRRVASLQGS